jgi:hypothetical protein
MPSAFLLAQQYDYETTTSINGGVLAVLIAVWLALVVFYVACQWKVFAKAGQPGWAAIVPFYNTYIYLKIAERPGWWILLLFIPIVNIVIWIIATVDFVKAYGKGAGFAVGMIFLAPIFLPMLAFGSARYVGLGGQQAPPAPAV